jgi:hypothetical protein
MRAGQGPALFRRLRQGGPALIQHSFDCFLASSAILSHAAARIDVIRTFRATADRGADALFIESIADADDHSKRSV